ncbi:MAG: class I SAM-dependent methyltransferase [Eubacteriales bacterium]|nr:class I SAM-dependent methyltransferase [Eubacteriales bacterium]
MNNNFASRFEPLFNRAYTRDDFFYFVPREERDYNKEWAKRLVEDRIIYYRWREDTERGGWKRFEAQAARITAHGGLILEICAGPGAGFAPAVLMKDYNARICLSDLCPTVLREWKKLFDGMDNRPPHVEYTALDVCDLPFADNSLDVVSGSAAVINIEGDRDRALREIYRVLKPGGLFAFDLIFVTKEYAHTLPPEALKIIKARFPAAFWDTLAVFDGLGFSHTETIRTGEWSNKDDESTLADLCRSLGVSLTFSALMNYCVK